MKKSLLALALMSAAACGHASDVEIYGVLDYGLTYRHDAHVNQADTSSVSMQSGQYIGSRFGIKASEDLGNGTTVGIVLENGFSTDTGALGQGGRLFGRDARVYLDGDFGYLSFGRMGALVGGNGPYARFGHVVSPFSCGWGEIGGHLQVVSLGYEFIDNAIAYTTPKFAGLDATFQYSLGTDSKNYGSGTEGKSSVERMAAGALRYENDSLMVAFGIESINQAQPAAREAGLDDSISYNLGANYRFGATKLFFYSQIFENYAKAARTTTFALPGGVDGYGVNIGFETAALAGTIKAGVGYGDFEGSRDKTADMSTWQTAVGYVYNLSKTTALYSAASWIKADYSDAYKATHDAASEDVYQFTVGLMHKF